jgi:lipid II:glycine glycyltransferase (peptidoglycan interpeptide bridge formation enzyme)
MKSNGSYLMQWKFIEWLKENQFAWYNLNGINPLTNPGTYRFKEGLCGKNGKDVYSLGFFELCENKLNAFIVKSGILFLSNYKKLKKYFVNYIMPNSCASKL